MPPVSLISRLPDSLRLEAKLWFSRKDGLPNERALLKGRSISDSKLPSILFFTVHKAASAYVNRILSSLAAESGRMPIDLSEYLVRHDLTGINKEKCRRYQKAYHQQGYYYGALRNYHTIPHLDRYRVVLLLRDPRDALTSHYFSRKFSHVVPNASYATLREAARSKDIDTFVLDEMPKRKATFERYLNQLQPGPNVLLLKYETMVTSFEPWLESLTRFLEISPSPHLKRKLIGESLIPVDKEDPHSHKRQVTPGDHRRKLKPETIAILNREFAGILERLDYPV